MEIWKDIQGYEGLYQVSDLGRVKSLERIVPNTLHHKKEMILKIEYGTRGYFIVTLYKNFCKSRKLIHRLVAETFIKNEFNKPYVNHINGIKTDNRLINLEWCTHAENIRHAFRTGLIPELKNDHFKTAVLQFDKSGNFIKGFASMTDAQKETGAKNANISKTCMGIRKSAGGFIWKYNKITA